MFFLAHATTCELEWRKRPSIRGILLAKASASEFCRCSIMVERMVVDIDEIVRLVRFPGWQDTQAGEREVKKALRKALFKYKLHADEELFKKAYSYIRQYY